MKTRIKGILSALLITLPRVFVLLFFGYFPIQYSVVLQTDNIVGEGICQTYVCPPAGYSAFYEIDFYLANSKEKLIFVIHHSEQMTCLIFFLLETVVIY